MSRDGRGRGGSLYGRDWRAWMSRGILGGIFRWSGGPPAAPDKEEDEGIATNSFVRKSIL
jgi:hypothetical protein